MAENEFSPFQAAINEMISGNSGGSTIQVFEPDQPDPDEMAQSVEIGRETGVPAMVVQGDLPSFQEQRARRKTQQTLRRSPGTASWLLDPNNSALARDDVEALAAVEEAGAKLGPGVSGLLGPITDLGSDLVDTGIGRAALRGAQRLPQALDIFTSTGRGETSADRISIFEQAKDIDPETAGHEIVRQLNLNPQSLEASMAIAFVRGDQDRRKWLLQRERRELVRQGAILSEASQELAVIAEVPMSDIAVRGREVFLGSDGTITGMAGAIASDPAGFAAFIGETAAEFAPVMVAATAATALTANPAVGVGVMSAGSFTLEAGAGIDDFLADNQVDLSTPDAAAAALADRDLMRKAQEFGLTRGVIIASFDALSGGIAGQTLASSPAGELVLQGLSQMFLGGAGEGIAQGVTTGKVDLREVVVEALAELATAPIEVGGVAGRAFLNDRARASRAGKTGQTLAEIDGVVAESKLKERAPTKFRAFLEGTGFAGQELTVPAQDLQTFYQGLDLPMDAVLTDLGIEGEAFQEALISGGDISIEATVYAEKVSGTDVAAWWHENSVLDPEEMSISEAARFNEEVSDIMQEAFDEAEARGQDTIASQASDAQVQDAVRSQLRAAGRSPDVAERESAVWAAFFRTRAERDGTDPLDLAREFGVVIEGPQGPEARTRDTLDIALNTLRANRGQAPAQTQSLGDFVREAGGLVQDGGSVELDAMAERAEAAGFFPNLPDGTDIEAVLTEALQAGGGDNVFNSTEGEQAQRQSLADLQAEMERRGLDITALSNDDIVAQLQDQDGETLFQPASPTDSDAFKAWFRDSKVVDGEGEPLVVFHGTDNQFDAFDPAMVGSNFGLDSVGIFLTTDRDSANRSRASFPAGSKFSFTDQDRADAASGRIISAYVSLQNPLRARDISGFDGGGGGISPTNLFDLNRERIAAELAEGKHDGFILKAEGQTLVVALESSQIKDIENRGTFDPADPRILNQPADADPRGSITFPEGGPESGDTVIRLFEGANLSTVLHESGHFFIEVTKTLSEREGAPQQLVDDMAVIHEFLGSEPGRQFTVEEQEKWARGFEAYLLEGNAPSLELADAFSRFKAWLTRIYKSVLALGVTITPEVRDVMDRMLATDTEIAVARESQGMDPLFTDEAQAGMSPSEFIPYQRMARRSVEQAEQALLEKTMEKVRRERTKEFRAERKAVLEEVTAEFNKKREYRLIEGLASQRWFGPDGITEFDDMQISRDALVALYGEGILPEISKNKLGGKRAIYTKDGADPQVIADIFGFASVDEMISVLQNAPKRKDAIAVETDRRMSERVGDPLNDGSIEEEALLAIHSEQQARTTATEARTLAKRAGVEHRNITSRIFRQRARMMLGRMKVSSAAKPSQFLAAERKAARAAQRAFARVVASGVGGRVDAQAALTEALRHKQAQLLNHMLYTESKALEQEVRIGRERMRRYDKTSVRKKLAGDYIDQIDTLLENYDFRKVGLKALAARKSLADFAAEMVAAGRGNELTLDPRVIQQANLTHFSQLTVEELRGLFDTIANIDHMGRFKQSLIDAAGKRDYEETVAGVVGSIRENLGTGRNRGGFDNPGQSRSEKRREWLVSLLTADSVLREIDGLKDLGPAFEALKAPIDAGVGNLREAEKAAGLVMDAIYKKAFTQGDLRKMDIKRQIDGVAEPVSRADKISLALNWGNDGNRSAVLESGKFTREEIELILGEMTESEWTFVQESWDFIDSFWDQISAVEERVTGVKPEKVERASFVTEFGVMRGGYYPLKYDASKDARANDETLDDLSQMASTGMFGKASTRNGFAIQRVGSGGRPVRFGLGVMTSHVQQVMHHIALGEAVANTARILNDKRVTQAFIDAGRLPDHGSLVAWIKDVAVGEVAAQDVMNQIARAARSGLSVSAMAFNLKTVGLQFTGIFQSAVVIGKVPMLKGMRRMVATFSTPGQSVEDAVFSKSKIMRDRSIAHNKDIRDAMRDMRDGVRIPGTERQVRLVPRWVGMYGFWAIVKAQSFVDIATWMGSYEAGLAQFDGDEAKAARNADSTVTRAQGSGNLSDRSGFERGTLTFGGKITQQQSEMVRLWTNFMAYQFAKFNVARERTLKAGKEIDGFNLNSAAEIGSYLVDMGFLFMVEAMILGLINGEFPDDDDDETALAFAAKEAGLAMLGSVPVVNQLSSELQGFSSGTGLTRGVGTVANALTQIGQGEMDAALFKSLNSAGGLILKYPAGMMNRAADALARDLDGQDVSPLEFIMRVEK